MRIESDIFCRTELVCNGQLGQVVQMQTVVNMQLYYDMLVFMLYAVHTLSIIHYMLWVVGHLFLFVIALRSSYFNDIFFSVVHNSLSNQ